MRLYGAGKNPPSIVMEFCSTTLESFLKKNATILTIDEAFDFSEQIARGMNYLHSEPRRVVHRDLKSANILVIVVFF